MKTTYWQMTVVLTATLLGLTMPAYAVRASDAPTVEQAQAIVETTTAAVVAVLGNTGAPRQANEQAVVDIVEAHVSPYIDYERLCRLLLGSHWKSANPNQRSQLTKQLKLLITRSYSAALPRLVGVEVTYQEPQLSKNGKRVAVRTQVSTYAGSRLAVSYHMYRSETTWRLYDLSVEGVSMMTTYRRSFAQQLKAGTIDTLIEHMAGLNAT